MSMEGNIAQRWKELQGIQDKWAALLQAAELDIDLRRSILVYGNMVAAIYDSLSAEEPRGCLFHTKNFFSGVGLEKGNIYQYEATKYIYVTAPGKSVLSSRYGAYVAVATDNGKAALGRRDIVVAWSGTITEAEKHADLENDLVDPSPVLGNNVVGKVHLGFFSVYTTAHENSPFEDKSSARDQVLKEVKRLVDLYQDEKDITITLTAHSMGCAVATLNSIDIVTNKYNRPSNNPERQIPVTVIAFASPKVGDSDFTKGYDDARRGGNLNLLRVNGVGDPVPLAPLQHVAYTHCGVEIVINARNSPYLRPSYVDPSDIHSKLHDIEVYCHGVAGSHNKEEFVLEVSRQTELLNKHMDILKDHKVPTFWWDQVPKGMVQSEDGTWHIRGPSP